VINEAAPPAETGADATSPADGQVAARAGLSPAALYVYFRSKEEVLHQIVTSTLDFTIEVAATESSRPGSPADRLTGLVHVLTLWTTYNSQVAHVVLYQTGALSPAHQADITARQRKVSQIVRQLIADGISSRDFDIPDPGAAAIAIAVLSLCLDVARWYRPGHRLTPQQIGDFNAVAALRIAGSRSA
jgi:AcrR family transcriptional regulator